MGDGWRAAKVPCLIMLGDRDSMLYPEEGQAALIVRQWRKNFGYSTIKMD